MPRAIDPARAFLRALIAACSPPVWTTCLVHLAGPGHPDRRPVRHPLLEVVRAGILPIPVPVTPVVFGLIPMIAIEHTILSLWWSRPHPVRGWSC